MFKSYILYAKNYFTLSHNFEIKNHYNNSTERNYYDENLTDHC